MQAERRRVYSYTEAPPKNPNQAVAEFLCKPSVEEFTLIPKRRQKTRTKPLRNFCASRVQKNSFLCRGAAKKPDFFAEKSGISSVGRALASQAEGRESESRIPLIQQAPPIKKGGAFVFSFHDMAKKAENVVALRFFWRGYDGKGLKRRTMKRKRGLTTMAREGV